MAKYTMTLAEYLEAGGLLPASFSQIQGFEDAFKGRYFDCEIGFETPNYFELKLKAKANLIMAQYAERIRVRATYWTRAENPAKTYYEMTTTDYKMGKQKSKTTELPFNSAVAEPNLISESEAYKNDDKRVIQKQDDGQTIEELMRMLDFLNKDVTTLVQKCLEDFKPLFMAIY